MTGRLESKIANVVLRCFQFCSAATLAAIVGKTIYIFKIGSNRPDGRFIYVEFIAAMTIVMSIVLTIPSKCAFIAWPIDFVVYVQPATDFRVPIDQDSSFVLWAIAIGILVRLKGTETCSLVRRRVDWHKNRKPKDNVSRLDSSTCMFSSGNSPGAQRLYWATVFVKCNCGKICFLSSAISGTNMYLGISRLGHSRSVTLLRW